MDSLKSHNVSADQPTRQRDTYNRAKARRCIAWMENVKCRCEYTYVRCVAKRGIMMGAEKQQANERRRKETNETERTRRKGEEIISICSHGDDVWLAESK